MPASPGTLTLTTAADQVGRRLAAAAIRHVGQLDARHREQLGREQVLAAAVARRGVVDLAGLAAGELDQLLHVPGRQRRMHHHDAGLSADQRDRREVVDRLVRQLGVQRRADGVGLRCQQQRVAVGWRPGHRLGADRGTRTGPVVDHHLLPQPLAQLLRHHAGRSVDRATRRERHDDADRPAGKVLRQRSVPRPARRTATSPPCASTASASSGRAVDTARL